MKKVFIIITVCKQIFLFANHEFLYVDLFFLLQVEKHLLLEALI